MENWVYHGSPSAGIKVLEPSVTKYFGKPRQVCLTRLLTRDTPFARYMRETYPASWKLALRQQNKEIEK